MLAAGYDKVKVVGMSLRGASLERLQILLLWMLLSVQKTGKNVV